MAIFKVLGLLGGLALAGPVVADTLVTADPSGSTYVQYPLYINFGDPSVYLRLSNNATLTAVETGFSFITTGSGQYAYGFFDPLAFRLLQNNTYNIYIPTPGPNHGYTNGFDTLDGFTVASTTSFSYSFPSSAPEPGTWMFMMLGIGLSGLLLRRAPRAQYRC
jgi:hypothetical protein